MKPYAALLLLALGCGGSAEPASAPVTTTPATSGRERRAEAPLPEGASITGLMGTISARAVQSALEPRMSRFGACFTDRIGAIEFLSGDITLSFRIHTDGTVAWVFPSASTIGDGVTERCILDIARTTRFAEPRGGEAEFTWGFGMDAASDVRLPLSWSESSVAGAVSANRGSVAGCGRTGFRLTAYVAPGGSVLAVGGTAPDADALPALECVLDAVRRWSMPDPGSYAAKVSFAL